MEEANSEGTSNCSCQSPLSPNEIFSLWLKANVCFTGGGKLQAEAHRVCRKTHGRCETWHFQDTHFSQDNYINHMNNGQVDELRMYAWLMMFWTNPLCRAFSCFNNQDTVEGMRIDSRGGQTWVFWFTSGRTVSDSPANTQSSPSVLYWHRSLSIIMSHRLSGCAQCNG